MTADLSGAALITAVDRSFYWALPQFQDGTYLVIHDPTELTKDLLAQIRRFRVITIRPSVQQLLADLQIPSTHLLHPFYPYPLPPKIGGGGAVSISRIDFDKHIDIILEANKQLGDKRILLYGALNRLCAHFKLGGLSLGLDYRGQFGKSWESLGAILADAAWVVDLSAIHKDGGGSQYTFLEAIYAGCALVLNRKWLEGGPGPFVHGQNCIAVETPDELVAALASPYTGLADNAKKILEPHLTVDWRTALAL